jgi:phage tail sheath gpL-like
MGLPATQKYPDAYIEVHFGAGSQSPADAPKKVLAIGYQNATGATATPLNIYQPLSIDEAETLHGPGSSLYLMAVAFLEEYAEGSFFTLPYEQAAGGVACVKTLTITNNATIPQIETITTNASIE